MNVTSYGKADADIVLIQMVDDHDMEYIEREVSVIQENVKRDFCLTALHVSNWNNDLSPWKSEAVFGSEGFGGMAEATIKEVLELCADKRKTYYIGGYSLAGLFALWAAYQTDIFEGVAAASPSIWFPGFVDYMKDHELQAHSVYLSLGDKEEKTNNQTMAKVGDCIRQAQELLQSKGHDVILEWNQGNHFKDADLRTARAFSWILNRT